MAFSPDGRLLVTADADAVIRIYSVPGYSLAAYFQPPSPPAAVAISPNGRELATSSGIGAVFVYTIPSSYAQLQTGITWRDTFSNSTKYISALQFLSNSTLIAGGFDSVVRFWTVPSAAQSTVTVPTQTLATHAGEIGGMSYSASTGLLATASPQGTRVWQTSPSVVATDICAALQAPVQRSLWTEYLPGLPYMPVC
jgi:WD40 repeat protein